TTVRRSGPPPCHPMAEIMFGARTVLLLSLAITCWSAATGRRADASVVAKGATYYLSPAGDDSNSGTTPDRPWRSFAKVLNSSRPLRPGDAVVLLDGTYTPQTTGLPYIDCHPDGN